MMGPPRIRLARSRMVAVAITFILAVLLFAGDVSARSAHPPPVRRVHHPSRSTLRIVPRGEGSLSKRSRTAPPPHTLRHDDTLLLTASVPSMAPYEVALLLRPTEHMFHPDAKITFQSGNGQSYSEPLVPEDWRLYQGEVVRPTWIERVWAEELAGIEHNADAYIGRASVMVHEANGQNSRWEGTFSVEGTTYHVMTREHYERVKTFRDADVAAFGNGLVIFSENDMDYEEGIDIRPNSTGCTHDNLAFNTDPEHPVLRRRDANPLLSGLGRRDRDDMGGMTPKTNYIESIGSTTGCPTSQQIVYMGVAIDCNYVTAYGNKDAARTQVLNNWNSITALYLQTFKVSLGIIELVVQDAQCPSSPPADMQWNQNCSDTLTLDDRLSLFSQWRGDRGEDGAGLWHLMTACSTDTEVGVAWLGTLCRTDASQQDGNQVVSGTGVSSASKTEWNLIAHEIGHGFGAIHDCMQGCSLQGNCCPFSSSSCNANGGYIMNPTTAEKEITFSPCSLGNICTFLGSGSKACVQSPSTRTTISLKQCGNGIVEDGEECDPGMNSTSSCCDAETCKFINNAVCDPSNSACCTDQCQFASAGTVCRPAIDPTCDTEEVCTGTGGECPTDITAKDGTSCGDGLECASGHCTSLDQQCLKAGASLNLTQACDSRNDQSCYVTCKDPNVANQCTILQTVLIDGSPCGYGGHCYNGTCNPGSWQDRFQAMYTQNLQIAIPVTIAVAIVLFMIIYSIARCCCSCFGVGRGAKRNTKKKSAWNNQGSVAMAPYPKPGDPSFAPNIAHNRSFPDPGQPLLSEADQIHHGQHRRTVSGSYSDDLGPGMPMREAYTDPYASGPGGLGAPPGEPQPRSDWIDPTRYNGREFRDNAYELDQGHGHVYQYDQGMPHQQYDGRGYARQ